MLAISCKEFATVCLLNATVAGSTSGIQSHSKRIRLVRDQESTLVVQNVYTPRNSRWPMQEVCSRALPADKGHWNPLKLG